MAQDPCASLEGLQTCCKSCLHLPKMILHWWMKVHQSRETAFSLCWHKEGLVHHPSLADVVIRRVDEGQRGGKGRFSGWGRAGGGRYWGWVDGWGAGGESRTWQYAIYQPLVPEQLWATIACSHLIGTVLPPEAAQNHVDLLGLCSHTWGNRKCFPLPFGSTASAWTKH